MCRLDALQAQCELWSGPIAAVAYVPLLNGTVVSMDDPTLNGTTVQEQHQTLALFHDKVVKAGAASSPGLHCKLTTYSRCQQSIRHSSSMFGVGHL